MLCTLDIEASGFGRHSYPIEVGYVLDDGRAWCTLIQPLPEWTHWDAEAARVHGITRAALERHGRTPVDVARSLNEALAGRTVYCDGWAHDYPWLATLFDAAGMAPRFHLESAAVLLPGDQLDRLGAARQQAQAALGLQRHRASGDARMLQRALATLQGH
jgi:hypothetical protein